MDKSDCRLDFFDPTDDRYEYRSKKERKIWLCKRLAEWRLRSFEFGFIPFEGLQYLLGIGGFSEYKPTFKISAIYVKFSSL